MTDQTPKPGPLHDADPARPAAAGLTSLDRSLLTAVLVAIALAVFAHVSASSIRAPGNALSVALVLADSGPRAAAYLAACLGWGLILLRAIPPLRAARDRPLLAVALGVSFLPALSQLMGALGLFGVDAFRLVAAAPIVVGVVALLVPIVRALHAGVDLTELFVPMPALLRASVAIAWIAGGTVLVVAACNPPGALWASEFGGYDSLSYHLQLPREWLADGTLRPLPHNVYSYLPGYVEAAFMHLGALAGSRDLLVRDGGVLLSCHLLHAGFTALAAWAVGRAVRAAASTHADIAASITAAIAITVPWLVVVGSLAYNESPMVLLLAAALALAFPQGAAQSSPSGAPPLTPADAPSPLMRGLLVGWFIGAACGFKPTALILGASAVAVVMFASNPARARLALFAGAAAAGLLALTPWLIRNTLAAGNPVFPQLAGVFGSAHWSPEQVARYAAAHGFDGSLLDRLRLIALPDHADPAASAARPIHRGLAHPQWMPFVPFVIAAGLVAGLSRAARRTGVILCLAMTAQLAAWLALTHVQSRFLLPIVATGGALLGVAVAALLRPAPAITPAPSIGAIDPPPPRSRQIIPAALLLAGAAWIIILFSQERLGGVRNALLTPGPGMLSGSIYKDSLASLDEPARRELLAASPPNVFCNLALKDDDLLYLLGDATPLYFTVPVLYNTTYDASPLAEAVRAAPQDPDAWIRALSGRGVTHALVNLNEIRRLSTSGWLDPDLTPAVIEAFISRGALVRTWDERRIVLIALPRAKEPTR